MPRDGTVMNSSPKKYGFLGVGALVGDDVVGDGVGDDVVGSGVGDGVVFGMAASGM